MRHLSFLLALWTTAAMAVPVPSRPGKEVRSLTTTSYEMSILKDGHIDVVLPAGQPVFVGAFPMIQLEDDEQPRPMSIEGLLSGRTEVRDSLGQGTGMMLKKKECEWYINTYETQPFFTVRAVYVNTTKKPVRVKALMPWCVGKPGKGALSLGVGTEKTVFLENERGLYSLKRTPSIETGDVLSLGNTAGYNAVAQHSLIAGFLTAVSSFPQIRIERAGKDPESIGMFRAECIYDPPLEVQPGGRLESDLAYIAVSEFDPLVGLERYGDATSHMGGARDPKRVVPHSWDSWSTKYRTDITEANLMSALDYVDKNLKRYGWTHFAIDDGWNLSRGDWEPIPAKFPHGMKWLADQVHARGMTAGIWLAPFRVDAKSEFAKQHADWLVGPNATGKGIVGDEGRILDITAPGAYEYVKSLMKKIANDWGYDVIKADYTYYLLFMDTWHDTTMTRAEAMRMGMRAIREGIGDEKCLMSFPPGVTNGPFLDALRIGDDTAPIWRKPENKWAWGCVDALTNAARRYYFAPYQWAPDQDCAFFAHEDTRKRWDMLGQPPLTMNQSIAWFTGAALTGGVVEVGDNFEDLTATELAVLRKLLPVPGRPARPVDLFEGGSPRIWSLPIHSAIGDWEIVGVFNWDTEGDKDVLLDFGQLGMDRGGIYTVFDFWANKYFGTAQGKLKVSVPPGSIRLLGLKPFANRPMFLSTNRHFTQGATDGTALTWDEASRRLAGAFDGVADTDYELKVLVPEAYTMKKVAVSATSATTTQDGKVLTIAFHNKAAGPVTWSVDF